MAITLSELDVAIRATGEDRVLAAFDRVDRKGESTARSIPAMPLRVEGLDRVLAALESVEASTREMGGAMLQSAAQSTRQTDLLGTALDRLGERGRRAGAGLARVGAGSTAGLDAIRRRVDLLAEGLSRASTRTGALARLASMEAQLERTLARGNLSLTERIRVEGTLTALQSARAGATRQETFLDTQRAAATARVTAAENALASALAGGNLSLRQRIVLERELIAARSAQAAAQNIGIGASLSGIPAVGALGGAGGLAALAGTTALLTALPRVADALHTSAAAADQFTTSQRKLQAVSRLTGVGLETIRGIARQAERDFQMSAGMAADFTQQLVKLTQRAGELGRTGDVMIRWLDLAAAQGLTAAEALQTIETTLIGQDEGLNRLGLANPQGIYEAWARAAGTSAAKMTEAQKAQAILNAVVAAGTKVQGEYQRSLDNTAGRADRLAQRQRELATEIGLIIEPVRRASIEVNTGIVEAMTDLIRELRGVEREANKVPAWARTIRDALVTAAPGIGQFVWQWRMLRALQPVKLPAPEVEAPKVPAPSIIPGMGGQTLDWAKAAAEAAKKASEARLAAIRDEVAALRDLHTVGAATAADYQRAVTLQGELSAEYARTNVAMRAQRAELAGLVEGLREVADAGRRATPPDLSGLVPTVTPINPAEFTRDLPTLPLPKLPEHEATEMERSYASIMQRLATVGTDTAWAAATRIQNALRDAGGTLSSGFTTWAESISSGVASVEGEFAMLGTNLLTALATSVATAIGGGNFGDALLSALGGILQQMGMSLITTGAALIGLLPHLSNPFTSGPAMIVAGTLIAGAGMALAGLAGAGGGGGGGGGGGTGRQWGTALPEPVRGGTVSTTPFGQAIPKPVGGVAPTPAQPVVVNATILGNPDARTVRWLGGAVNQAIGRGIVRTGG